MISTHAKKDFGEKSPNLPVFQEIKENHQISTTGSSE
jgi:hypothetical protein